MNTGILIIVLIGFFMSCIFLSMVAGGFTGYFYITDKNNSESKSNKSPVSSTLSGESSTLSGESSTLSGESSTKKKYKIYNKDKNICLRTVHDGIDQYDDFGCRGSDESWYFTQGGNLISTENNKPLGFSDDKFVLSNSQNDAKWTYDKDKLSLKLTNRNLCLDLYDNKSKLKWDWSIGGLKEFHYPDVQMLTCDSNAAGQKITMEEQ